MRRLQAVASGLVLAALLFVGFRSVGPLPALGPFLEPVDGVWAAARSAKLPAERSADVPGLGGAVRVVFDDRAVPHIFAGTLEDAVRALGYVTARDRLFQLELQTRATAGTLSEILGDELLEPDREQRALGLAWSAEQMYASLRPESRTVRVLEAYADGVNAWIDGLHPREYPLEYRLLGAEPMRWRPVYAAYLIRYMGQVLSYQTHDRWRERVEALIGEDATMQLFPVNSPLQQPVIPFEGSAGPESDDPLDGEPDDSIAAVNRAALPLPRSGTPPPRVTVRAPAPGEAAVGSNNWAVAPARAAGGFALLAADPHLELTLPAIWYEAHLVVPGQLNVYGATIPGAPVVAVGFNRQLAWSFTNVEADLIDYYAETLDDPDAPTAYAVDGVWRPLTHRVEEVRGKRGQLLATDTVYFTHRGPLQWYDGRPLSMRWVVLEAEDDLEAFLGMAQAGSVSEWLAAFAGISAIAQNGAVADWLGNVAIRTAGRFPLRPGNGGFDVFDGSTAATDWLGYLPPERLPTAVNPPQGFVASANQQPVHPLADTTYFGVNWPSPWRAMRINELLAGDAAVTAEDMMRFQTDPGSARADTFVPVFLEAAQRTLSELEGGDTLRQALALLTEWDRRYTRENERAVLFELAMDELLDRTWDELRAPAPEGTGSRRVATPTEAVLADLLAAPFSRWWDDPTTSEVVEDRDAVLNASLVAALTRSVDQYGPADGGGWRWDRIRQANIYHLLRLPALSALALPVQGGPGTLSPLSGSGRWGASWRMVVELRPEVRAWTTYPGGQSGNPASPWYRDRLDRWLAGELDPVVFPAQPGDIAAERVLGTWTLRPPPGSGS